MPSYTMPHAEGAGTPDELRRIISEMLGELNASHLGISAPGGVTTVVGRLGVDFDGMARRFGRDERAGVFWLWRVSGANRRLARQHGESETSNYGEMSAKDRHEWLRRKIDRESRAWLQAEMCGTGGLRTPRQVKP